MALVASRYFRHASATTCAGHRRSDLACRSTERITSGGKRYDFCWVIWAVLLTSVSPYAVIVFGFVVECRMPYTQKDNPLRWRSQPPKRIIFHERRISRGYSNCRCCKRRESLLLWNHGTQRQNRAIQTKTQVQPGETRCADGDKAKRRPPMGEG